ncbi:MAG: glycosyltransferase [Patescibacteria group bacterium]
MNSKITISFIIIAYNEERSIARCLSAILAQNNLTNYEVVVVDDGSKDRTAHIVAEHAKKNTNVILHRLVPNQGRGAARAAGVKIARGDYFAFVDADTILPTHWLDTCLGYMDRYDSVGGIAVPDGDVNYVYTAFNLDPKVAAQSTIVTGNNGFYKRKVFENFNFDIKLREGEDVAFNHQMRSSNFKIYSINSLVVEHREAKTFGESVKWLYQSGVGASRQLKQFKKIRLPDLAYFGFLFICVTSVLSSFFFHAYVFLVVPVLYIFFTSLLHLYTKFTFHVRDIHNYFGAILVNSILIASYYSGRTTGVFITKATRPSGIKKIMLCFDFEGKRGMPFDAKYNVVQTANYLLNILQQYHVKAVFFVVGKIIEEHPDLIKEIARDGHEIALHGYEHEHLDKFTEEELAEFGKNLVHAGDLLEEITGKRPTGFRAPFLEHATLNALHLSSILKQEGYVWTSNQSIRHEREFLKPKGLPFAKLLMMSKMVRTLLFVLLNWRFLATSSVGSTSRVRVFANLRWLLDGAPLFSKNGLIEIHAHAPFDCEMVGLPRPDEPTSQILLDYAVDTFVIKTPVVRPE